MDVVEGLGDYIELEVVLFDTEPEFNGIKEVKGLVKKLDINKTQLVHQAYFDLLTENKGKHPI